MMRIFLLLIIILTLQRCKGQGTNKLKQETIMETIDIKRFEKNKNNQEYKYTIGDSTIVEESALNDDNYIKIKFHKDDLIRDFYRFYPSGKLKIEGKFFHDDFEFGKWIYYDEEGNFQKAVDFNKPFTYSWENIKKYLKEHGVNDFKQDIVGIQRFDNPDKTYWELEFQGEYKELKGQFLIELDGKTGEELLVKKFKGKDSLGEVGTIAVYDTIYIKK